MSNEEKKAAPASSVDYGSSSDAEKAKYPTEYPSASGGDHTIIVDGPINDSEGSVKRVLKQRHMTMIALGGSIGTGLFIGSGAALSTGGPVGCWLGYIFMSFMVWSMMVALGEMAALFPVAGAFTHYAARFVDPGMGFALGINYWYSWAITIPVEVVAGAILISYWDSHTNAAVYMTVLLVCIWFINFWGTRVFGEAEFWFSMIKIITIVGLIILGIILMAGGGPDHDPIGFRYWRNPGPFNTVSVDGGDTPIAGRWGQFLAFWAVFVQAAFSFIGTELVATTIGEATNPRKTVPKAIKQVFYRLMTFYVLGIFVISVLVPSNDTRLLSGSGTATASPFVIAIQNAGIHALPSIANACFLSAAWSAGIGDLYAASRTMYALALERQMPGIFRRCTKNGTPIYCIAATGLFGLLCYLNTGGEKAVEAFNWLYNISSITGIIAWWAILFTYIRFYYGAKRQGLDRKKFPYVAPFQPYLSWFGLFFFTLVLLLNGFQVFLRGNWDTNTFIAAYISLPIFAVCWIGWKVASWFGWTGRTAYWVSLDNMDFETGRRELDEMEERDAIEYDQPKTALQKVLNVLF